MCLIKPDRWEQANIIDHQLHTDHQVREIWVLKSVNPEATSDRNIGAIEISIDRKWNWIESIEKWPRAFVSPIHPCPIEHTKQHKCYGVHTRRLLAGIFIRRPPPNRIVKKCGMIWKTCLQFPVPTGVWQQRTQWLNFEWERKMVFSPAVVTKQRIDRTSSNFLISAESIEHPELY